MAPSSSVASPGESPEAPHATTAPVIATTSTHDTARRAALLPNSPTIGPPEVACVFAAGTVRASAEAGTRWPHATFARTLTPVNDICQ